VSIDFDELKVSLDLLIGMPCWSIIAGKGTGSIVSLGFGTKNQRDRLLKNLHLTDDERIYKPDISLMIYCSWRLSVEDKVFCSWKDALENLKEMLIGLELIREKNVINMDVCPISLDLNLYFEKNIKFEIFCDETNNMDADDNYSLFTKEKIINAGLKSIPSIESRKTAKA